MGKSSAEEIINPDELWTTENSGPGRLVIDRWPTLNPAPESMIGAVGLQSFGSRGQAAGAAKMTLSKTTRDHDEIRKWAESRGAVPAEVAGTEKGGEPGILRFEFPKAPHHNDSKLKEIEWDDFFEKFDENDLELVYQEKTADGQKSNFNKLVHPSSDEHSSKSKSGSSSHSGRSNKSGTENANESKSASRGSSSHSSGSSASHNASSKAKMSDETDMEDEDLDDDAEEIAGADDLDDNGEPRHSASSSSSKSGKSNKSSGSSSHSSGHSSASDSSASKSKSSSSKKK
jgi:hypothetical protein